MCTASDATMLEGGHAWVHERPITASAPFADLRTENSGSCLFHNVTESQAISSGSST
jgi:hypothetical protein